MKWQPSYPVQLSILGLLLEVESFWASPVSVWQWKTCDSSGHGEGIVLPDIGNSRVVPSPRHSGLS